MSCLLHPPPPQATGTRLGTLMETMFGLVLALVIAFVYSWVLTFLILAVFPIVMIAGLAEVTALSGHTQSNKKAIETAGKVGLIVYTCTCGFIKVRFVWIWLVCYYTCYMYNVQCTCMYYCSIHPPHLCDIQCTCTCIHCVSCIMMHIQYTCILQHLAFVICNILCVKIM